MFQAATCGRAIPQKTRPVAAEHQRQLPRRWREEYRVGDLVESSVDRDALLREQAPDDLERLLEPADQVVEGEAERRELRVVPAGADPEPKASTADLVDGRRHAREHPGRVVGGRRDERSELDPRCRGRESGELRPDVPGAALTARRRGTACDPRPRSSRSLPPRPRGRSPEPPASARHARPPAAGSRPEAASPEQYRRLREPFCQLVPTLLRFVSGIAGKPGSGATSGWIRWASCRTPSARRGAGRE